MNRFNSSRSSGFGGNDGPPPNKRKRTESSQRNHRHCVHCGNLIFNQVEEKPSHCPFNGCRQPQPLREGNFGAPRDWSRCSICDSFIHADMVFCQLCGQGQKEAFLRRERKIRAAAESEKAKLEAQNRELAAANNQKSNGLMEQQKEIEDLRAQVKKHEADYFAKFMEGVKLDDNVEGFGDGTCEQTSVEGDGLKQTSVEGEGVEQQSGMENTVAEGNTELPKASN